jgi:excisionase family DNA binding protein
MQSLRQACGTTRREPVKRFTQKSLEEAAKILHITVQLLKNRLTEAKPKAPKEVMRTGEVAAMLGCHNSSVIRWTEDGLLHPLFRLRGQGRRYQRSEVERFMVGIERPTLLPHPPEKHVKIKSKRSSKKPHATRSK